MMATTMDSTVSRPSSGIVSPKSHMRSRAQSISSDRPSTTMGHGLMSPPLSVSPEAAYIAASAASQIVTNDHDSHADTWYDQHGIEPAGETALVSPGALQLVNNFLDQLLFNFLLVSRATTLTALRPAVSEVLKPKLAKDAINLADEELREYLGGDDEGTEEQSPEPISPKDWDLELAWKRTRLRCMVYSSLGDMEEEDEDYYMEQGHLDAAAGERPSEVVSPAVAIFLTSIMEFMGEQALIVAGQASYHRMRTKYEKELKDGLRSPADVADRVVVEELDMERVALDRTLGRLWRAWKKKIRSPGINMDQRMARSFSRDSTSAQLRSPSSFTAEPTVSEHVPEPLPENGPETTREEEEAVPEPIEEYLAAAAIPLPMGARDVDEIEVPGLAYYSDDETEADEDEEMLPIRPKSLMIFSASDIQDVDATPTRLPEQIPQLVLRKRSNSLPAPAAPPLRSFLMEAAESSTSEVGSEDGSTLDEHSAQTSPNFSPEEPENEVPYDETATIGQALTTEGDGDVSVMEEAEDFGEDEDEAVIEEPQILISSRISISGSGRSASPASERSKPAAIVTNLPLRTPSIRSARLIDVAGPRSPAAASRRSSGDVTESVRQASSSRVSGGATPPIIEKMRRSPDSMSAFRAPAAKSGLSETHSVSEAEEVHGVDESREAAFNSATGLIKAVPEPIATVYEEPRPLAPARSVFGSVAQRATAAPAEPPTPPKPVTKVTIITSGASGGTFYDDDKPEHRPEPPRKSVVQTRPQPVTPTNTSFSVLQPAVPERSAVRQSPSQAQPSTIGQVYVERSRNRSPEPFGSRIHESPNAPSRQQHTSSSNSSASTNRLKPVRTSEETTRSRKDVARNFEELIHSDETIQYTLTPESMRDIDSQSNRSNITGSPVMTVKTRKSDDVRNGDRSRSSSFAQPNELKRSSSITRSTQATGDSQRNPSGPSVPSKTRVNNIPQARDARLPRESVAELAEFIRSTGPAGASVTPAALRDAAVIAPAKNSVESGRVSSSSNMIRNARLQARGAAVDYRDDNSDLIDFIRRGPPAAGNNPRIPRTVAPFRTTMDSDQMAGAVGGRAVDAQLRDTEVRHSQASTNPTDLSVRSVPSSINSQSALLGRNKPLPGGGSRFGGPGDDDMPMPKRKTRRVRDPYAIDLSDEDEDLDDLEATPRPPRRAPPQEESLLDFLKSVPPPPEPVVQPFSTAATDARPKKKASAPSLMARFTRRDSTRGEGGSSGGSSPRSPMGMFGGSSGTAAPAEAKSSASRANGGKGYIPIQVNMPPGADKYAPTPSYPKTAGSMGSSRPAGSGRVPMKKFEPREAVSVPSRGTSELAEFFKNSEPPPGLTNQFSASSMDREDPNAFSKRFGRRKKTSVA